MRDEADTQVLGVNEIARSAPAPLGRRPRDTSRVVLLAVVSSIAAVALVAALGFGGYEYHRQVGHVSALKAQRFDLKTELSATQAKLLSTQLNLGKRVRSLNRAKTNLTKMSKELVIAKKKADQSYAAGYSTGTDSGYNSGYSQGSSSGYDNGLYAASDQLTCSDDATVTWLPYCN